MDYTIEYTEDAIEHLERLSATRRATVVNEVDDRLGHQPTVPARNRKRMDPGRKIFVAPWELRLGDLRVYYDVEDELHRVIVVAVGLKERERLFIGGKEVL